MGLQQGTLWAFKRTAKKTANDSPPRKLNSHIRSHGIYYTALHNPFSYRGFASWAHKHRICKRKILEPFAGSNNLIGMLQSLDYCNSYDSYDLHPQSSDVRQRDTLLDYPQGYEVCVTNPPWLYKSRATRLGLSFPETTYDDLYKHCLASCLRHSPYVAALIPASFIQSGLFRDRLETVIFIHKKLFSYTDNPVCLGLFGEGPVADTRVEMDDMFIGNLKELETHMPGTTDARAESIRFRFNVPDGDLGFVGIDNSARASIAFHRGEALERYPIKSSSRAITRIGGTDVSDQLIRRLNERIRELRHDTHDIFLTVFKGLRKDGRYRRRMEYRTARDLLAECL